MTASWFGFVAGFLSPYRPDFLDLADLTRGFGIGFLETVIVGRPFEHFLKLVIQTNGLPLLHINVTATL
jgi:hypothetical protein